MISKVMTCSERLAGAVGRKKEVKKFSHEETIDKKKAILAALAKASEDSLPLTENTRFFDGDSHDYYTLSHDEMQALVSGDMEKIERWVSNMDRNHATRLLRWLIKERW